MPDSGNTTTVSVADDVANELRLLEERVRRIEDECTTARTELAVSNESLSHYRERLRGAQLELDRVREAAVNESERATRRFDELSRHRQALEIDLARTEAQRENLLIRLAEMEQQNQRLTRRHDELDQRVAQLQGIEKKFNSEKKGAQQKSRALEAAKQQVAVLSASDKHYRHATHELRKSVSFRLGQVFVRAAERPFPGIFLVPFRFAAVVWKYLRGSRLASQSKAVAVPVRKRKQELAAEKSKDESDVIDSPVFKPFVARTTRAPSYPVIATVLDEFSEQCFASEAQLLQLSRYEWRQQLSLGHVDMLLVESAWRANRGQWKGKINRCATDPDAVLTQLVETCRKQGIPTVFWNKEDPLNFDQFIDAARLFDHVFTTDESLLDKYRHVLGHERVYALPFAAQPNIHNPAMRRDEFDVAFAGSWFADKHDARRAVLEPLLDAASGFNLHIFDRHSALGDLRYAFPKKYQRWIRPALPYPNVLTAYRRFKVFLNANSVLESPTMFSRRVLEVLACGTPVVSTPSSGMDAMLAGLVRVARDEAQARTHIDELLSNEETRRIEGHLGMREVFRTHTYRARLDEVMRRVGLRRSESPPPRVSIVLCTNRPENLPDCLHNVRRQSYPDIELLLVLNRDGVDLDAVREQFAELPRVTVLHVPETCSLYTCLNTAIAECSGAIWSKMDDDNIYGDHYIEDMVRAMEFSGADVVGKSCYYTLLEHRDLSGLRRMGVENDYVKFVQGGTISARVATTSAIPWNEEMRSGGDSQFLRDIVAAGLSIYSADRFNFVSVRRGDEGAHTWTIKDGDYLKRCEGVRKGIDLSRILI